MAINERLVHTTSAAAAAAATGGNQEEGLILHLDANDVDSYDGDGTEWIDIANHEYKPTTNVSEHFNTVTYTGNGASNPITGVGFQPDLIWVKRRTTSAANHYIVDTVRGNGTSTYKNLSSNTTDTEGTTTASGITNSTIVDGGFTMQGTGARTNASGSTYAAWCLKAGGAPSGSDKVSIDGTSYSTMTEAGLTDGTEPISKLSVNTKLGFSIVKYTAPALTGDTVAHGLGETPEMIIHKSTSVARNWNVFHKDVGTSKNLHLNATDAGNTSEYWTANSNTFSIQDYSTSAGWIAYAFTSKRGVSKVGSYTGTGAAGNKVYTEFEPAFVMVKASSYAENWIIYDNKRSADDPRNEILLPASSSAELSSTNYNIDFDHDGFTINSIQNFANMNGVNYIYLAFAKDTNFDDLIDDTDLELHLDPASYSGSGTTWTADTGSDATISGASYDEELGDWFDFDGSNDIIKNSSLATAFRSQTTLSIEAWFKTSAGTARLTIASFSATGDATTDLWLGFYASTNTLAFRNTNDGANVFDCRDIGGSNLRDGNWHHVVFTADSGGTHIYVDGDEITGYSFNYGSASTNIVMPTDLNQFSIGGNTDSSGDQWFMNGQIGQVRVYSSALSHTQIRQNFNFTKNDYPNGLNQTINGATFTPGTGSNPDLFRFDGANDSISLDDRTVSSSLTGSNLKGFTGSSDTNYTISFYINTGDSGGNSTFGQPIIGYNASDVWAALSMKDNKFTYSHYNGSWNHKKSTTSINDSAWHHCVFVHRSDATIDIYVDGTKEVDNVSATLTSGRYYIAQTIGKGYSGEYIDMDFGMLKIYDKALTSSEVTSEFNNTKSTYGLN